LKLRLEDNPLVKKFINNNYVGKKIDDFNKVFNLNDIIYFSKIEKKYLIEQLPKINGAVIIMDPYSGKVLAMSGGFDFRISSFNRAVQAKATTRICI
jgi:penicillin-binding protein 1A